MVKTNIRTALAILTLSALVVNNTYAVWVGTGSVSGTSSYDTAIDWDGNNPGFATGSITGLAITANVLPILNMVISTGSIDLGTLSSVNYSTGSLDIEVGTNAGMGVNVTALSGTGGLRSASVGSIINNQSDDGVVESYRFSSILNAAHDSSITGYNQFANLNTEVNNNTGSYTIYQTTKPETSDGINDVIFFVSAKVDDQTPAGGDYQDTVTITVVGNF